MSPDQIRGLVSRYIAERLNEWEHACYLGPAAFNENTWQDSCEAFAKSAMDDCAEALSVNDLSTVSAGIAGEFIDKYKLKDAVTPGSDLHRFMCRELLKAERVIAGRIKERTKGDYGQAYETSPAPAPPPDLPHGDLLSVVLPAYLRHFEQQAPSTLSAKKSVLLTFIQIVGDKPFDSYVKADCILYRDTLRQLPTNAAKRYPGLTIPEIVEQAKTLPATDRVAKTTVNQNLTQLSNFFNYLIKEGKSTKTNPVMGLSFGGVEHESHEAFKDADIVAVFTHKEFTTQRKDDPSRYWLPLILLHSGMRLNEAGNLSLADLQQEDGIHYFDLKPDASRSRRLKNKASRRCVPVHSALLSLGLLEYANGLRVKGEALLFPPGGAQRYAGLRRSAKVGTSVSRWFNRLVRKVGIKRRLTPHGLRSTVITKLHEAGVDGETRRKLLGHSGKDVHDVVYLRPSLPMLREQLEKLKYTF